MNEDSPVYVVQPENSQGRQRTLHRTLLYPCNDLPIDESVEVERWKKKMKQNRSTNVANTSKRSNETRGTDSDEDEINIGFYPNELQPNAVHDDPDIRALINEKEPDPEQEQDLAADKVQEAINEPGAESDQDEQEQVIVVDNAQDQDILPQRYNAPETEPVEDIQDDVALSPDVEPPQRPQRTRFRLMYETRGHPANYHINYVQQIPRYVEPLQRTVGPQMIPFTPGYVPPYHQLFMTPRVQFCHPQPSHPLQYWNAYPLTV